MITMYGKPVADSYKIDLTGCSLAILVVGENDASKVYAKRLEKIITGLGGRVFIDYLPEDCDEEKVLRYIHSYNRNSFITGILPMMPMPKQIDTQKVCDAISPYKDVDCLNSYNIGDVYSGVNFWAPCTPRACLAILDYYNIPLDGKNVVVVGRSNTVGKPVAALLLQRNATVTVAHSHTKNLPDLLKSADIVIAAIGKPHFIKADMLKENAVVIDVGINVTVGGIVGDVEASDKLYACTPVPKGVGVVSNAMVAERLAYLGKKLG